MNAEVAPHLQMEARAQQEDIVAHAVHSTGTFTKFEPHEIEQAIPVRFEEQVRKFPERIAVKSKYHQFTYRALNQAANRIAHAILDRQGELSEAIALLINHDTMMVAAMLGVLKAGKFFVVLDTELPDARLAYILADTETRLILTDAQHKARATKLCAGQIDVLDADGLDDTITSENPNLVIAPEAYAYLIYTSGTSGTPKGVIENHLDVCHFVRVRSNSMHFCPDDQLSQLLPFSFSGSMTTTFGSVMNGATLSLFDIKHEGIPSLIEWISQERLTILVMVPPLYRQVVASLQGHEQFPDVRILWLGGDQTLTSDIETYRRIFRPECVFSNGYGTSEVKAITEYYLTQASATPGTSIPVGYPVVDTEVLLLNETDTEVGPGEIGEIVVRSRFISPGYWRRPEISAAKFVTDPLDSRKRLYRTGDLGRRDADGCLYHLGRKDFQVKVRGQRVEAEEIESALLKIKGIREAAVTLHKHDKGAANGVGNEQLVAYLATQENGPNNSEIRRQLAETLPIYMIPENIVRLAQLPLNANGKIDRKALPLAEVLPELVHEYIEPAAGLEATIAKIWARTLGIARVGALDDFFDLGGQSLLAVQMLSALEKSLGQKVPVQALLHGQSVRGMAAWIQGQVAANAPRVVIALQVAGTNVPMCLVPPLEASALTYVELARELGPEQPFYAIDDAALPGNEWTIAGLATYYLAELRAVQPSGPYILGGRCFGAKIALEMTRQLEDQGQEVALLVIMEGEAPELPRPNGRRVRYARYARRIVEHARRGTVGILLWAHLKWRWKNLMSRVSGRATKRNIAWSRPQAVQTPIMIYESKEFYQLRFHERWQQWADGGMEYQVIHNTKHDSMWRTEATIAQIAHDLRKRLSLR